jgi:hypothetical protein
MPKDYEQCVESYTRKGMSTGKAKAICAAAYYKRHGMTVKQAHDRGIEGEELSVILENNNVREGRKTVLLEMPIDEELFTFEDVGSDGVLRYEGTALIDNVRSANRRYYSKEFNNAAMKMTLAYMKNGGSVTVYSRHGKAYGGIFGGGAGLPIGQVLEFFRKGNKIKYRAEVLPTSEGKDAIMLIQRGVNRQTSIRSLWFRSRLVKDEDSGEVTEEMIDAIIQGVDLAEEAGIEGAGIDKILEEAPNLVRLEEVTDMLTLEELTLEELGKERPDLLKEYADEVRAGLKKEGWQEDVSALEGDLAKAQELNAALKEANEQLQEDKANLEAKVGEQNLDLAIQVAAQLGVSKEIAEALKEQVKTIEEIEQALPTIKEAAMQDFLASASTEEPGTAKGKQRMSEGETTAREAETAKKQISEEVEDIVRFAGGKVPE